jgi:hypothetical protein
MSTVAEHPAAAPAVPWTDGWRDEVALDDLSAGDRILATTRNHTYEIVVQSPWTSEVEVRGGDFCREFSAARLAGSLLGGRTLKLRSVGVGLRLEFAHQGSTFITTRVRAIRVVAVGPSRNLM